MFAQAPDVDFNRVLRDVVVVREQTVRQLVFGENLAWCIKEQLQKAQFAIAHHDGLTPDRQMARDGIENDAANLDCRLGVAEFPPQNGATAGL